MKLDAPLPPRSLVLTALAGKRGEKLLFSGVDLIVRPGEIAELRGANGAGKTTLLMIVAGIVRQASGTVTIEGSDPEGRPETDIGYLSHRSAIKSRLSVSENLAFWTAITGGNRAGIEPPRTTTSASRMARTPCVSPGRWKSRRNRSRWRYEPSTPGRVVRRRPPPTTTSFPRKREPPLRSDARKHRSLLSRG